MKKTLWPSVIAAALLAASCETTDSGGDDANSTSAAASEQCEIGSQSRQLNATLRRASEGSGDLNAFVAANAAQIEGLAREAGGGASGQRTPAREASCRAIALRAYSALLRSQSHEAAAFEAIAPQAEAGERACTAITNPDAGARADCDLIAMWMQSHEGLAAARELQAISASVADASESAPVSDEAWSRVDAQTRIVQDNVSHWRDATQPRTAAMVPVVAAHRTRVVCNAWAPLVSMRNLEGRGSEAWQRVYAHTYPATMLTAVNALSIPDTPECGASDREACDQARVLELERRCAQLAGR